VNRLQDLCQLAPPAGSPVQTPPRRGFARQRPQRLAERHLRERLVDFGQWARDLGWSLPDTAELLHLAPRTLRHWRQGLAAGQPVRPLGRPVVRAALPERQAVLELLQELGAGIGLPTLQSCFPNLARAALEDLLRRYRRVCRLRYHETLYVLHWRRPGSVWAMDFTETPQPVDGLYRYLLAVRDLASGQQLLWLPVAEPTAAHTCQALATLFAVCGAPLVLKSDNGPAFLAEATRALLASAGVIPLFSPPYQPQYNGSIEAGIGSLKTRTERQAARAGHPGDWTHEDVALAQAEANATARAQGVRQPTPQESWEARRRLTSTEREMFQATVARLRAEPAPEAEATTEGTVMAQETQQRQRQREREVIRRALVEHGLLLFSRRRIPLPIRRRKTAKVS
jgi:transposase InsO family protein